VSPQVGRACSPSLDPIRTAGLIQCGRQRHRLPHLRNSRHRKECSAIPPPAETAGDIGSSDPFGNRSCPQFQRFMLKITLHDAPGAPFPLEGRLSARVGELRQCWQNRAIDRPKPRNHRRSEGSGLCGCRRAVPLDRHVQHGVVLKADTPSSAKLVQEIERAGRCATVEEAPAQRPMPLSPPIRPHATGARLKPCWKCRIYCGPRQLATLFADLSRCLRSLVSFDFINLTLLDPKANVFRLHILQTDAP